MSDYDEKAENAVNYFDIDEDFEGPETQAVTEEDHLLPKKEYLSAEVSWAKLQEAGDEVEENYDEESEREEEHEVVENDDVQSISVSGMSPVGHFHHVFVILYLNHIFKFG